MKKFTSENKPNNGEKMHNLSHSKRQGGGGVFAFNNANITQNSNDLTTKNEDKNTHITDLTFADSKCVKGSSMSKSLRFLQYL